MAKQLLAKEVTAAMIEKLQARVSALKEKGITPKLGIIRCGENPSDLSYERGATKRADEIGVAVEKFLLPEDVTKEALIAKIEEMGFSDFPVCMAKNQYSLSDDAKKLGRPENFDIHIREVYVSAGAGFVVALTGAVMTMPGLPKVPAANGIDVTDDGKITGLF